MEKPDLELLLHRTLSDPVFRNRLMVDPETALREAGWDLAADDVAALKVWHANLHDVTKLDELKHSLQAFIASRQPGTR